MSTQWTAAQTQEWQAGRVDTVDAATGRCTVRIPNVGCALAVGTCRDCDVYVRAGERVQVRQIPSHWSPVYDIRHEVC